MDIRNKHPPIPAQTRNKFPQLQSNTDADDLILKSMKLPEGEPPIKKVKENPNKRLKANWGKEKKSQRRKSWDSVRHKTKQNKSAWWTPLTIKKFERRFYKTKKEKSEREKEEEDDDDETHNISNQDGPKQSRRKKNSPLGNRGAHNCRMGESQNSSSGNTFSVPTRLGLGFEGVLVSSFEPYFGPSIQERLGRDKRPLLGPRFR